MNQKQDLKKQYPIVLRISLVINLIAIILLFILVPKSGDKRAPSGQAPDDFKILNIPIVRPPEEMAKRPPRPQMPVNVGEDDLIDDVTIPQSTNIPDYRPWDEPPPLKEPGHLRLDSIPWKIFEKAPEPIGGYAAILANIDYPDIAKEAGIEGTVSVVAHIDEKGNVTECGIVQGVPNTGLDEAAIEAVKKTKFKPALQRDQAVDVYIVIPIKFVLN